MTEEEKRDHAARILELRVQDIEYSMVYEDEELSKESKEVQIEIHGLLNSAQIFVTWPASNSEYQIAGAEDE